MNNDKTIRAICFDYNFSSTNIFAHFILVMMKFVTLEIMTPKYTKILMDFEEILVYTNVYNCYFLK